MRCYMAESKLRNLSTEFAVKVIKLCDSIKRHHFLVNQSERSQHRWHDYMII